MIDMKTKLMLTGYYLGELDEITQDIEEFDRHTDHLKYLFDYEKENHFIYRNVVRQHPEYPMHVDLKDLPARRKIIEENNYEIGQQWYETSDSTGKLNATRNYFRDLLIKFLPNLYTDLDQDKDNIWFLDNFSVFTQKDFIEPHVDGKNKGRLCVVLIYMNQPDQYTDDCGGELVLSESNLVVPPVKGRFVILDFTKHNIEHEVRMVKNDFRRYTYISFVYNKEEMEK